jgi:lipopolysaccharide transport system ATP-binding protein
MTDIAIKVENLSKLYHIGLTQNRHDTLRDQLVSSASRMFRRRDSQDEADKIWALKNISFQVKHGEVLGVIGRNGAGKTTLLKILSRITEPTSGRAVINGRIASLLEVGTGFHPELTGRENIFLNGAILGMAHKEINWKFDEIVDFSGVEKFLDTPVKRYSSGMYVRLAFAVAAHLLTEILVIDEVLAVGDIEFQKKCLSKMGNVAHEGRTIIFVSHNMGAVSNLCNKGLLLTNGTTSTYGDTQQVITNYLNSLQDQKDIQKQQNVLYENENLTTGELCAIIRIEMLDIEGNVMPVLYTQDQVVFRIWYKSKTQFIHGSVVLNINGIDGSRLILLSTQPDGILPLTLEVGEHCVECVIKKFPLAAGEYLLGAGLAIPNIQWLWNRTELAKLTISPRDVYNSGTAPTMTRSYIALDHEWRNVN